jgi:hypothetical protein
MDNQFKGRCGSCKHWFGTRYCSLLELRRSSHAKCDEYVLKEGITCEEGSY